MSKITNAADAKQVEEAELRERDRLKREDADLRALMESPHGRRFIKRALDEARVFSSTWSANGSESSYREGRRSLGLWLLAELDRVAPEAFIEMQQEALAERKA